MLDLSSIGMTGLIGIAGACGAVARYLLGRFVAERVGTRFPVGTFCINLTGAFLIGIIFALATRHVISAALQSVLATGFLGGYTTFSTMSWEGVQLFRGSSYRYSLLYLGGSVICGLLAVLLGLLIGGHLA
ncbi:fluoride efflux transporter CrcB [Tengunoibacter tsumagoiensis]|uniref:Fluoride-specific ion channel FluC n=1 Tax=Tengunoibacter tsumagoiensis TaxID=2014871 RepID=A0A402A6R2_9CHLR|nr:fluoride efflux transporter CrcB [Tengunoibacter tsumagoiensis]GCE14716.1 putative fluoride ion transporter CrcB 2 [Tengunoibacter tsumagoiensis]